VVLDILGYDRRWTPIHNLDPRVKLLAFVLVFIQTILYSELYILISLLLFQLTMGLFSKLSHKWLSIVMLAAIFTVIILITNLILGRGFPHIITFALRLYIFMIGSAWIFATTNPDEIGQGLEKCGFSPRVGFVVSYAMNFIPVLRKEVTTIIEAQESRGLQIRETNVGNRLKNSILLATPLSIILFKRSFEISEAMATRAFGLCRRRTYLYPLKLNAGDLAVLSCLLVLSLINIVYWRIGNFDTFLLP